MRNITLTILVVLLPACASPQQRAADERARAKAYFSGLQARCAAYGFQAGTSAFADCVRREDLCAQERQAHSRQYYSNMLRENRPGSSFGQAASRAETRTPRPVCF